MYNMLQQPTCPLLLMERTLHVSMVQLFGSLTIPYPVQIHLKRSHEPFFSYISKSVSKLKLSQNMIGIYI
jgi:hypothetical protein